jgi:hypothetical protein
MKQQTLWLALRNGFEPYAKKTRRTLFFGRLEPAVSWAELYAPLEPVPLTSISRTVASVVLGFASPNHICW